MHYILQLQPKGRLARMEWDPASGRHVECAVADGEIAGHLHDSMCFAPGTTLRDLLAMVARDADLFEIVAACEPLREIIAEIGTPAAPPEGVVALELSWGSGTTMDGKVAVLEDGVEFYGLGGEGQVAIEMTPSNCLADLPILLNESFAPKDEEGNPLMSAARRFTMLEIVRGVLDELTFLGSPSERDAALVEVRERMADTDEAKFVTMEDMRREWDRRAEEDRKRFPCRACGADNRCACFGKPEGLCHDCFQRTREN